MSETFLEWLARQTGRDDLAGVIARDVASEVRRIGRPLTHLNDRAQFAWYVRSMPIEPKITREDAISVFRQYLAECEWPRLEEERKQQAQEREQKRAQKSAQPRKRMPAIEPLAPVYDKGSGAAMVETASFAAIIHNGHVDVHWWGEFPPAVTLKQGKKV